MQIPHGLLSVGHKGSCVTVSAFRHGLPPVIKKRRQEENLCRMSLNTMHILIIVTFRTLYKFIGQRKKKHAMSSVLDTFPLLFSWSFEDFMILQTSHPIKEH